MKLIIQIPCYNEEKTLPMTLAELPKTIPGIDAIEWLIIDDGSTDHTVQVAREQGVHHIVEHKVNRGLAAAYQSGMNACIEFGADIIVNTDADNQYPGRFIPDLIRPILEGRADLVIGNRQTDTIAQFSPTKKLLQKWGSAIVRYASQTNVPDAPSGFRAITRDGALRMNIFTDYTYTLETIIQAGYKNLTVASVPIQTNPKTRESRLIKGLPSYVWRSALTILHLFMLYKPLRTFTYLALPFLVVGAVAWARYLLILVSGEAVRGAHIQSVVLGGVLIILSFIMILFGLIGDLIATNRRLHEETLYYVKRDVLKHRSDSVANPYPGHQSEDNLSEYPEHPVKENQH